MLPKAREDFHINKFLQSKNRLQTASGFLSGTPCGNRTHNEPLGGVYYIHLTKGANCHVLILQYGSNFVNKKGRPLSALRWLFFFGVLVIVEEIIPVYCIQLFLILFGESWSLWELFKFLSSRQLYLLL